MTAAVIAGLLTVGLGAARERQLDDKTDNHVFLLASTAHCAYAIIGRAPASTVEMREAVERSGPLRRDVDHCDFHYEEDQSAPKIDYARIDDSVVRICTTFRQPREAKLAGWNMQTFPTLLAERPAGHRCYDIDLAGIPLKTPHFVID